MLRAVIDTLLGHDVGAALAPPDTAYVGAVARRAPARNPGRAAPTAGAATHTTSSVEAHGSGPLALGCARAPLDRMANRARRRQAGDRYRLAPTKLPAVVGLA